MDLNDNRSVLYALRCVEALPGRRAEAIGIAHNVLWELREMELVTKQSTADRWWLRPQGKIWLKHHGGPFPWSTTGKPSTLAQTLMENFLSSVRNGKV